jgi:O-antigen/teichoic acid export membrane protein
MEKHVSVVAALQIGLGIFGIIAGIFVLIVLNLIGGFTGDKDANFVLSLIGNIVAVFMFVLSVPGIIAGIGLLRYREWARILTLVLSVLSLLNFPLGTAVGIYSIWVLAQEETVTLFKTAGIKEYS